MARCWFFVVFIAGLAGWAVMGRKSTGAPAGRVVLDRKRADYLEDEPARRALAEIRATLYSEGGKGVLRITTSAEGAYVDPEPGYRGVRGANLTTARELKAILERRLLKVETTEAGRPSTVVGTYGEGRRGRVPGRRLLPGGRLDLQAESEELPLELVAESGPLADGVHTTVLTLQGKPRLRARFRVEGGKGEVLELESVSERTAPPGKLIAERRSLERRLP